MPAQEIFADGISTIQVIGETVRLDFVSLVSAPSDGKAAVQEKVRIVMPRQSLAAVTELLQRTLLQLASAAGASRTASTD